MESTKRRSGGLSSRIKPRESANLRDKAVVRNVKVSVSALTWENQNGRRNATQSAEADKVHKKGVGPSAGSERLAGSVNGHGKRSYPTICDLCPEDKKRVKELIEQLARLGYEKENLEGEMMKDRSAYQGLLETLKTQYHEMAEKKNNLEAELKSLRVPPGARAVPQVSSSDALTCSSLDTRDSNPAIPSQPRYSPSSGQQVQEHHSTMTNSFLHTNDPTGHNKNPPARRSLVPSLHVAQNKRIVSPSCSSTTFTNVHLSPSKHFKANRRSHVSEGVFIPRSNTISSLPTCDSSQHPHHRTTSTRHRLCTPGIGQTSSPYTHQPVARGLNGFPTKQRARFPSVISTISSISTSTDDVSTVDLPISPQCNHIAERKEPSLEAERSKQPPETIKGSLVSGGNDSVVKGKSNAPSEIQAARDDASPGVAKRLSSSSNEFNIKVSCHTIDSGTQTLNVESKAVQTENEASPYKKYPVAYEAVHKGTNGTFMPSAYVSSFGNGVQDQGAPFAVDGHHSKLSPTFNPLCETCSHGGHPLPYRQPCDSSLGSHHLPSHGSAVTRSSSSSVGHRLHHTVAQTSSNPPYRKQNDHSLGSHHLPSAGTLLDCATRSSSVGANHSPYQPVVSSSISSAPSNLQSSNTRFSSTSTDHPLSHAVLQTTPPTGAKSSVGIGRDVLLASSLLNLDTCDDRVGCSPSSLGSRSRECNGGSEECTTMVDVCKHPDIAPKLNSSLDIAFSLNCEQPASLADSPSRSTYENPLHIRITTPTNRTPVVLHKELSDGQPCLSPARKNPPPTHSSKDLASSLNQYFDDGMVLSSTRREECSDPHVSRTAEQTQGEAMTQSGGCSAGKDSSASELSGEDNLINELFFIQ